MELPLNSSTFKGKKLTGFRGRRHDCQMELLYFRNKRKTWQNRTFEVYQEEI